MSLITPDLSGVKDEAVKSVLRTILDDYNGRITRQNISDDPSFYQELKRVRLTAAADTITVSNIPARRYLKVIFTGIATGGTLDTTVVFNGDTDANYARHRNVNGTWGTDTSASNIAWESGATDSGQVQSTWMEVTNIATQEKSYRMENISQDAAGGATNIVFVYGLGKWANTSAQISSITWTNAGSGDFAIGSEMIVLGHN